ncbi:hypothetical protein KIN20_017812 [Parelaphostrongylus tenuis]|uniref:Uncharacterized protein n=1 Tax=Parelaphostrongylus tenuis TaxID=148309 RepID=A0AAD5QRR7_PARTN|nr:hypothetical protein KIN20_017812 [Parelaphostrongylus tenuis]
MAQNCQNVGLLQRGTNKTQNCSFSSNHRYSTVMRYGARRFDADRLSLRRCATLPFD